MTKLEFDNDSWISKVVYDTESKEMHVTAYGSVYTCVDVPQIVFDDFKAAASKGKFFNSSIKGKYVHYIFK